MTGAESDMAQLIYFVYEREMPTVEMLRSECPKLLERAGASVGFRKNTELCAEEIEDADALVLIRPHNVLSQKIAEYAKKAGCFVAVYMDDDLFEQGTDLHAIPWRLKALDKALGSSDVLVSPNQRLCEKYCSRTATGRGAVVHFCVTDAELADIPRKRSPDEHVKLVYAAGAHHAKEAEKYIYPLLKRLNETHGDKISMTFVGVEPNFDRKGFQFAIDYVPGMPLEEYRAWMRERHFDIGFAPLDGSPFDRMKYFVKYIEYTLVGTVGVYSNCEPYTLAVEDGADGFLADGVDEWAGKTAKLIDDASLRARCLLTAEERLRERFGEDAIYAELSEQLPELLICKPAGGRCPPLTGARAGYRLSLMLDTGYLFALYLKRTGLRKTLERAVRHFRTMRIYKKGEN